MDKWIDKILAAREKAEVLTGYTPTHVMVQPEIWAELSDSEYVEVFEIDGMPVGMAVSLNVPFVLLIDTDSL